MEFYDLVSVMDASEQLKDIHWFLGSPNLEYDQKFLIFHRKPVDKLNPSGENGQRVSNEGN
jgi:hypothetical protein